MKTLKLVFTIVLMLAFSFSVSKNSPLYLVAILSSVILSLSSTTSASITSPGALGIRVYFVLITLPAGAQVIDARVVDDGDIVTCGGVTSSIDLALWLVERIRGAPLSAKIATGMEYIRNPSIHRSKQAAG